MEMGFHRRAYDGEEGSNSAEADIIYWSDGTVITLIDFARLICMYITSNIHGQRPRCDN
jgi:hypothetical protein